MGKRALLVLTFLMLICLPAVCQPTVKVSLEPQVVTVNEGGVAEVSLTIVAGARAVNRENST